jgi:hypothetical protein
MLKESRPWDLKRLAIELNSIDTTAPQTLYNFNFSSCIALVSSENL